MKPTKNRNGNAGREVDYYMSQIHNKSILSKDETYSLINRWQRNKDKRARDKVVEHNLRLAANVAMWYWKRNRDLSCADLIQLGSLGLIKACDKFDTSTGHSFLTYAVPWVRSYVQRGVKELLSPFSGIKAYEIAEVPRVRLTTNPDPNEIGSHSLLREIDDTITGQTDQCAADDRLATHECRRKMISALRPFDSKVDVAIIADRIIANEPVSLDTISNQYRMTREVVRKRELDIRWALNEMMEREYGVAA